MTTRLEQHLQREGPNVARVASWIRQELASHWEAIWIEQLPVISDAYDRIGEPAYGLYNRELFAPIQQRLAGTTLTCKPALPGTLPLSEENWGPEDHRERRMWTLLYDERGTKLGAIVTRFFHDHTRLRLPEAPTVVGLSEVGHDRIRAIVRKDPSTWPAC